jgi:formyltetrahydrofolate hydrolase
VILTISCPDRVGVVSGVTAWIAARSLNIVESQQFGDVESGRFFMRVRAEAVSDAINVARLRSEFAPLVGTTAHYVTGTLDEGPIIEQAVAPVTHAASVEQLAGIGRDLECAALTRAVQWHVERRVLVNGDRTVVFS